MANSIVLDVSDVQPGVGNAPGTIIGFEDGEPRTLKAFGEMLVHFQAGNTYKFDWYMGKEYQGERDMLVSKHGEIRIVGGNGSPQANQPPQRAESSGGAPAQQNTPQGVMVGAAGARDRSITILAVMKSVIESGGSEEDFKRWLELHDETLSMHGKSSG